MSKSQIPLNTVICLWIDSAIVIIWFTLSVIRYQGMKQKRQISLINNYPLCQRWFQTGQFRYRAWLGRYETLHNCWAIHRRKCLGRESALRSWCAFRCWSWDSNQRWFSGRGCTIRWVFLELERYLFETVICPNV